MACTGNIIFTEGYAIFLFKSYTSSFYGIDLWFEKMPDSHLDKACIACHKVVKRMA